VSMSQTSLITCNNASELKCRNLPAMGSRACKSWRLLDSNRECSSATSLRCIPCSQNASQVCANLAALRMRRFPNCQACSQFQETVGMFLETRGTKVDTLWHILDLGTGAFLRFLQPWVGISRKAGRAKSHGSFERALGVCRVASIASCTRVSAHSAEGRLVWVASIAGDFGGCWFFLPRGATCRLAGHLHNKADSSRWDGSAERSQQGRTLVVCGRGLRWWLSLVFSHSRTYVGERPLQA